MSFKGKGKKGSILDLNKYMDQAIRVKFSGGREGQTRHSREDSRRIEGRFDALLTCAVACVCPHFSDRCAKGVRSSAKPRIRRNERIHPRSVRSLQADGGHAHAWTDCCTWDGSHDGETHNHTLPRNSLLLSLFRFLISCRLPSLEWISRSHQRIKEKRIARSPLIYARLVERRSSSKLRAPAAPRAQHCENAALSVAWGQRLHAQSVLPLLHFCA